MAGNRVRGGELRFWPNCPKEEEISTYKAQAQSYAYIVGNICN
jgi:hypothetical protein